MSDFSVVDLICATKDGLEVGPDKAPPDDL